VACLAAVGCCACRSLPGPAALAVLIRPRPPASAARLARRWRAASAPSPGRSSCWRTAGRWARSGRSGARRASSSSNGAALDGATSRRAAARMPRSRCSAARPASARR
jgi:hypothetical protein